MIDRYKIKYPIGDGASSIVYLILKSKNNMNKRGSNNLLIKNLKLDDIYINPEILDNYNNDYDYDHDDNIKYINTDDNSDKYNKYAVKIIKDTKKYIDEIYLYIKLDHPNIIKGIEYFKIDSKYHIIFPYYKHGNLYEYNKKYKLGMYQIKYLMYKLGKTLEWCHKLNIYHYDIKPENILLDDNIDPILIDFGYSNINNNIPHTRGTVEFLAPEIILHEIYSAKSDIWSYGIVIYELLVGNTPFDDKKINIIRHNIIKFNIICPLHLDETSIDFLDKIIERDPNKRIDWNDILTHKWFNV